MIILEAENISKCYGERLIFQIDSLKIYSGDRIGIVGLNGCGKTTLMNVLTKRTSPDEGEVRLFSDYAYIEQFDDVENFELANCKSDRLIYKEFGVHSLNSRNMSGGEKARLKIACGLKSEKSILFVDEPTSNLDYKGVQLLEEKLLAFNGALVVVTHDRVLMDKLCSRIIEIEKGKVKVYEGNYSAYRVQKDMERERQEFEYEQYVREKQKLQNTMVDLRQKVKSMKKAPSRMGNSEARLHTRNVNGKKAKVDRAIKAIEKRVSLLEVKEKPRDISKTKINIQESLLPTSKISISVRNISKKFGSRILFEGMSFEVKTGSKVALVGDNGSGKTTLINMILNREEGIRIANGSKIGYFSQNQDILDNNLSILENVMKTSAYPEHFVRTILARLLFKADDVHKKAECLSGGERVKAAFAKMFSTDVNLLILDEPTNYMDVYSMEALESVLKEYTGTVLFVSHDRRFIEEIADECIHVCPPSHSREDKMDRNNKMDNKDIEAKRMLLEIKLSEVSSKLCLPSIKADEKERLNREYGEILKQLNLLKT